MPQRPDMGHLPGSYVGPYAPDMAGLPANAAPAMNDMGHVGTGFDPHYQSTSLILNYRQARAGQLLSTSDRFLSTDLQLCFDESKYSHVPNNNSNGGVTYDTTRPLFGIGGFLRAGSAPILEFDDAPEFRIAADEDFTYEVAYLPTSLSTLDGLGGRIGGIATAGRWGFGSSGAISRALELRFNSAAVVTSRADVIVIGAWNFAAYSRVAGVGRIFASIGTPLCQLVGEGPDTNDYSTNPGSIPFRAAPSTTQGYTVAMTGWVQQCRLTKGVGRFVRAYQAQQGPFPTQ